MIAHPLFPAKKKIFFTYLRVQNQLDSVLAYSTSEEQNMIGKLGLESDKVRRIYFHADQRFFCPGDTPVEPDLICAAGQLLRDYDCLIEAVRGLPVRVQIAAGKPRVAQKLQARGKRPANGPYGEW